MGSPPRVVLAGCMGQKKKENGILGREMCRAGLNLAWPRRGQEAHFQMRPRMGGPQCHARGHNLIYVTCLQVSPRPSHWGSEKRDIGETLDFFMQLT